MSWPRGSRRERGSIRAGTGRTRQWLDVRRLKRPKSEADTFCEKKRPWTSGADEESVRSMSGPSELESGAGCLPAFFAGVPPLV